MHDQVYLVHEQNLQKLLYMTPELSKKQASVLDDLRHTYISQDAPKTLHGWGVQASSDGGGLKASSLECRTPEAEGHSRVHEDHVYVKRYCSQCPSVFYFNKIACNKVLLSFASAV